MVTATQTEILGSEYIFGDDLYARMRLNLQHFLTVKTQGYLLHPSIPVDKPDIAVADIGTGTGIWLLDLADQLPSSARLWGGDLNPEQFDPLEWLPSNVELQYLDVFQDLSHKLEGRFDVVNVRYLAFVLTDSSVKKVLQKLIRMLKPGGYLQWFEPNKFASAEVIKTKPSNVTIALKEVRDILHSLGDRTSAAGWMGKLGEFFQAEGLQNIQVDQWNNADPGARWRIMLQEDILAGFVEMEQRMAPGEVKDRFAKLLPEALRESRAGASFTYNFYTWVGQKPV